MKVKDKCPCCKKEKWFIATEKTRGGNFIARCETCGHEILIYDYRIEKTPMQPKRCTNLDRV